MSCATCQGNSDQTAACFLKAIDILKQHFLMMQSLSAENVNTIRLLKQRNEKLHKAVELLQQQQKEQLAKSSPKRRRLSPKKQQRLRSSLTDNVSPLLPESQDSLNMNIALQPDEDEEETIMETEPAISPYKPWGSRRQLNKRNCENERPENTFATVRATTTSTIDPNNVWLGKTSKDNLVLAKKKLSLTLRSDSPKLKQTRLQFDASKSNDKEVIESSPNLYSSLKQAKHSRSLLQRADKNSASAACSTTTGATAGSSNNQVVFDMDDDDSFFDLCPDPSAPQLPVPDALPGLSGCSNTSSVLLLTPATQEIVFVDDSIDETHPPLNTMDFMKEVIKENDKASLTKLQEFEAKLIKEQKLAATTKVKNNAAPVCIKSEPLTELPSALGNESTKLPEDFNLEEDEQAEDGQADEEDEIFPLPIVIKKERELSLKERYNIRCGQCEKFINFMGTNLNDEKIRKYLDNCKHRDERELDNMTPEGFWNPHMVTFEEDDPRNEVHKDRRFVDQRNK